MVIYLVNQYFEAPKMKKSDKIVVVKEATHTYMLVFDPYLQNRHLRMNSKTFKQ